MPTPFRTIVPVAPGTIVRNGNYREEGAGEGTAAERAAAIS
jgi:hypothetical protein